MACHIMNVFSNEYIYNVNNQKELKTELKYKNTVKTVEIFVQIEISTF